MRPVNMAPAKTQVEESSENLGATILRAVLEELLEGITYITVGRQSTGLLRLRFFWSQLFHQRCVIHSSS